jgi:hypothetical protein
MEFLISTASHGFLVSVYSDEQAREQVGGGKTRSDARRLLILMPTGVPIPNQATSASPGQPPREGAVLPDGIELVPVVGA